MKTSRFSQLSASILANAIYAMKNFPVMLVNTILAPFGLLIIIFFVSHGTLLNVGILGGFILVMVNNGISIQGDLTHLRNDMKLQDMLVSSPVSPAIYVAGIALSELVFSIPDLIVLSILAVIFIHISATAALTIAAVMLLTFMFSISLGFFHLDNKQRRNRRMGFYGPYFHDSVNFAAGVLSDYVYSTAF